MRNAILIILLTLSTITLNACSASNTVSESFLRDDFDFSYISRVAVLPFTNNSQDRYVAERVRDLTITQCLSDSIFDVVDKGITDSVLKEEAVDLARSPMSEVTMKIIAQRLDVQAYLMGTIDLAGDVRKGDMTVPELAVTLRLIDANSGTIFWQSSGNVNGDFLLGRLFGLSPDDKFRVTLKLVKELLSTIPTKSE